eukprot:13607349-Alexandrium_andersonii.AAC.1
MSASLVGSEMCIRDRLSPEFAENLLEVRDGVLAERLGARRLGAQRLAAPVSYTHLTLPTICSV